MSDAINLPARLAEYIRAVSVRDTEVQRRLAEETAAMPESSMQTSPEQAHFLGWLTRAVGVRRCLEIGVFTGYTSLAIAAGLPEDGKLIACDVSEKYTAIARRYWSLAGVDHKIDLRLAPAIQTLDELLREGRGGGFDFAYIDADKGNYLAYYERALELVRRGGIIAADNVLWSGAVVDAAANDPDTLAIRAFNERLRNDDRVSITMLAIRDGLTLACKL